MSNLVNKQSDNNSRINNTVNGMGGLNSSNKQRGGESDNESFTKNNNTVGSHRKGESPHNRDSLTSKSKKIGSTKDNNSIGGINIGNYGPGLNGLKM